jgi:hypothetical protein
MARTRWDELVARAAAAARRRPDREPVQRQCAWCGRIEVASAFVRIDDVLVEGLPEPQAAQATHGICPECLERTLRESGLR